MSTPNPFSQPSFFPTHAIVRVTLPRNGAHAYSFFQDHPFAGIGAGTVAVLCMNPLDLLKVKFQVSTRGPEGGIGRGIWRALCDVQASEGWRGLWYRGFRPECRGEREQLGALLSLVRLLFSPRIAESERVNLQLQSAQAARD